MSILRLKAEAAKDLGPAELIDTVLVPVVEADPPDRFVGQPGCLSLQVLGDRGGEWTIDLEEGEIAIGAHPDPDCRLRLSAAVFGDLIRGRLDATGALDAGDLQVSGDPSVLTRLSELLAHAEVLA